MPVGAGIALMFCAGRHSFFPPQPLDIRQIALPLRPTLIIQPYEYIQEERGFYPPALRNFNYLFLSACLLAGTVLTSCRDDYDDTALWDTVNNHEQRLAALEEWQNETNHNIQSLYTLINTTDYITSVTPLVEGGVEVGYTITFLHSDPITIYHGKKGDKGDKGEQGDKGDQGEQGVAGQDGADGHTPQIGLTQEADGNWYWTMDGQLMLDPQGNPIRANGEDGQDGQDGTDGKPGQDGQDGKPAPVPQISLGSSIEGGTIATDNGTTLSEAWYLSVDNGETWYRISGDKGETGATGPVGPTGPQGPAGADGDDGQKGEDGDDGQDGDTMFAEEPIKLSDNGTHYIFTLADGQTFKLPVYRALTIGSDGQDGALQLSSTNQDITIGLPTGNVDDYEVLLAELFTEGSEFSTRASDGDWSVTANLETQTVSLTSTRDGSKALLRITLIAKDGTETVASRTIKAPLIPYLYDYYYSDGTCSSGLYVDESKKKVIGVVCSTSPVTKDGITYNHGLVIALDNAFESMSWDEVTSQTAISNYNATAPAPDNSSGWFLPEYSQIEGMSSAIDAAITAASGTQIAPQGEDTNFYWTSTTSTYTIGGTVYTNFDSIEYKADYSSRRYTANFALKPYKVRYFLAF